MDQAVADVLTHENKLVDLSAVLAIKVRATQLNLVKFWKYLLVREVLHSTRSNAHLRFSTLILSGTLSCATMPRDDRPIAHVVEGSTAYKHHHWNTGDIIPD